jgi:hypothetical protein
MLERDDLADECHPIGSMHVDEGTHQFSTGPDAKEQWNQQLLHVLTVKFALTDEMISHRW